MNSEHTPTQADRGQLDAAEAEIDRLSEINRQLVRNFNTLNCEQAKLEEATRTAEAEAARLREELGEAMEALRMLRLQVAQSRLADDTHPYVTEAIECADFVLTRHKDSTQ